MNTFVLVVVVFVAVTLCTAEDRGPRDGVNLPAVEECAKVTKADDSEVKLFMTRQLQTTKAGWCMFGCIKKKSGVINTNNQIDVEKLKENMAPLKASNKEMYEKILGAAIECKKQVEADPKNMADECMISEALGKCYFSKKAAAGIS